MMPFPRLCCLGVTMTGLSDRLTSPALDRGLGRGISLLAAEDCFTFLSLCLTLSLSLSGI